MSRSAGWLTAGGCLPQWRRANGARAVKTAIFCSEEECRRIYWGDPACTVEQRRGDGMDLLPGLSPGDLSPRIARAFCEKYVVGLFCSPSLQIFTKTSRVRTKCFR